MLLIDEYQPYEWTKVLESLDIGISKQSVAFWKLERASLRDRWTDIPLLCIRSARCLLIRQVIKTSRSCLFSNKHPLTSHPPPSSLLTFWRPLFVLHELDRFKLVDRFLFHCIPLDKLLSGRPFATTTLSPHSCTALRTQYAHTTVAFPAADYHSPPSPSP